MRILIDECIDEQFRSSLRRHDCQTARYAGLAGLKNSDLLTAAEAKKFDVFLTVDQGIEYQQNLEGRKIAIIIFRTKSNRLSKHCGMRGYRGRARGMRAGSTTNELSQPSRNKTRAGPHDSSRND